MLSIFDQFDSIIASKKILKASTSAKFRRHKMRHKALMSDIYHEGDASQWYLDDDDPGYSRHTFNDSMKYIDEDGNEISTDDGLIVGEKYTNQYLANYFGLKGKIQQGICSGKDNTILLMSSLEARSSGQYINKYYPQERVFEFMRPAGKTEITPLLKKIILSNNPDANKRKSSRSKASESPTTILVFMSVAGRTDTGEIAEKARESRSGSLTDWVFLGEVKYIGTTIPSYDDDDGSSIADEIRQKSAFLYGLNTMLELKYMYPDEVVMSKNPGSDGDQVPYIYFTPKSPSSFSNAYAQAEEGIRQDNESAANAVKERRASKRNAKRIESIKKAFYDAFAQCSQIKRFNLIPDEYDANCYKSAHIYDADVSQVLDSDLDVMNFAPYFINVDEIMEYLQNNPETDWIFVPNNKTSYIKKQIPKFVDYVVNSLSQQAASGIALLQGYISEKLMRQRYSQSIDSIRKYFNDENNISDAIEFLKNRTPALNLNGKIYFSKPEDLAMVASNMPRRKGHFVRVIRRLR